MSTTNYFVCMTVERGSARFSAAHGKYEVLVCRWEDCGDFIKELLETDEAVAEKTVVAFELIESTLSFEDWCRENDCETD